jgi:hypothetical protein
MERKELIKLIGTPLSFDDIQNIMMKAIGKKVKIIQLNEMCHSKETIDEILDDNNDMAILYLPVLSNYNGHFCSIFESPDKKSIYFCDSYGNSPKELIELINNLGYVVDKSCLFAQMRKKYKIGYMNTIQYQTEANGVADCGKYATANLIFKYMASRKNQHYDLNTFYDNMLQLNTKYKTKDFDDSVTLFAQQFLK